MSSQETSETSRGYDLFGQMPFTKLFTAFRSAIQPGRLFLALVGVAVLFVAGFVLDRIWGDSAKVMSHPTSNYADEIEAAVAGQVRADVYRSEAQAYYEKELVPILTDAPFNETGDDARKIVADNDAYKIIKEKYRESLSDTAEDLENCYANRKKDIEEDYDNKIDIAPRDEKKNYELMRDKELEELKTAYNNLVRAMVSGQAAPVDMNSWIDRVMVVNPKLTGEERSKAKESIENKIKDLNETLDLAQARVLSRKACGQGIFEAFFQFKMNRFRAAVQNLLAFNLSGVRVAMTDVFKAMKWLVWEHPLYSVFFFAIWLVTLAIFGGAICRMAALQFARDERIGPMHALKFSLKKFGSFVTAPLVPLAIIILIGVLLALGGLLGAIPGVGEIIAGVLMPLALFGGFVIALVAIGLTGGFNLMYPAIAVEGSDSFDAISRSFSYLFSRPWRLGFYTLVAWIYGAICYLVVRLFVFVTLAAVRCAAGLTMNFGGSSMISARENMDAIWPKPSYWNLVGDISWATLGWTEWIGAGLIFIWVALAAGIVLAFMFSFFYTAHTTIYFLLRQRVDATDLEDVYIEEPMENLLEEAKPAPAAAETSPESAPTGGEHTSTTPDVPPSQG